MHFNPLDFFYLEEAFQRIHYYPPPFFGYYLPPWLWYDGDQHGGFDHLYWESFITQRMSEPAPVTITLWGYYNPTSGSGSINAQYRNDSSAAITGRVIFAITEDSLYYVAPNGAVWHNHVPRDYLPDHNGEIINIDPGDSTTVTRSFSIDHTWNDAQCRILTWIQDDEMQADSTREIWQAGMLDVGALGVMEYDAHAGVQKTMKVMPNPSNAAVQFSFSLPHGADYRLVLFDALGRMVKGFIGSASGGQETVTWSRDTDTGDRAGPGVYFYRLSSDDMNTSGKLIVQ